MSNTIGDPVDTHRDVTVHTRDPHDPAGIVPVEDLVAWWTQARTRSLSTGHGDDAAVVADLFTELALGTRIARGVTSGRWVVVAHLLRAEALTDWREVGTALGTTGREAAVGFASWLIGQVDLHRRTGIGLTAAEAEDLTRLAGVVAGSR